MNIYYRIIINNDLYMTVPGSGNYIEIYGINYKKDMHLPLTTVLVEHPPDKNYFRAGDRVSITLVANTEFIPLIDGIVDKITTFTDRKSVYITRPVSYNISLLPIRVSDTCDLEFGSALCGFDVDANKFAVTIEEISSEYVVINTYPETGFYYGVLEQGDKRDFIIYTIEKKLFVTSPYLFTAGSATLVPTCSGSFEECKAYNRTENFTGFRFLPNQEIMKYLYIG